MIRPGGEFDKGFGEPCSRIQSVELRGAKQGLEDGGTLPGAFGSGKQPVFLTDSDGANGIFHWIVMCALLRHI